MERKPQNLENHAKYAPAFHFVAVPVLSAAAVYFGWRAVQAPSLDTVAAALFAVAVLIIAFVSRLFALGVQDRVIRLEERLRLESLLPEEEWPRIPEFSTDQLIGLRFASDEELPELARRVLAGELHDRTEIKKAVRDWRADYERI
ncbi:MAG: hypothetical protein JSU98_03625 [Gemmatimonadales bacterium]|jgi:hypothetical protein|nr:MAG: hypothetical protein JSU98_03625 [Gemmatimonadales bacterium]